jgi:hypothetical protein
VTAGGGGISAVIGLRATSAVIERRGASAVIGMHKDGFEL